MSHDRLFAVRYWYNAAALPLLGARGEQRWLLNYTGSMTALMQQRFVAPIRIVVTDCQRRMASANEAALLGVRHRSAIYLRDIDMYAGAHHCLSARTVLPSGGRDRLSRDIRRLGNASLATALRRHRTFTRDLLFGRTASGAIVRCTINHIPDCPPLLIYETASITL